MKYKPRYAFMLNFSIIFENRAAEKKLGTATTII